ncbi:hypothetical protein KZ770_05390 [Escherichia coli]|nr:hypothetical protein [Escherichia coli]
MGKKPDRCDVLQELIDCGDISAKDAKSTQKAPELSSLQTVKR